MPKKLTRPAGDYCISSVAWELENQVRHEAAGFGPIAAEVTFRRFYVWVSFLQRHGLTTRTIAACPEDVGHDTEFRCTDLTDEGFEFTRRFHGRWLNRMFKGNGDAADEAHLERWLHQFRQQV